MIGRTRINRAPLAAGLLLLAAFGGFLFSHTSFAVGGSDSSGYFNAARLISRGAATAAVTPLGTYGLDDSFLPAFIPLGMAPGRHPRTMAPRYPIGYPAHVAAAALLLNWEWAPFLISPLAAVALLFLQYRLARELGLSGALAAGAAAILATCPFFFFLAIQQMSDVVAALWSVLAILAALVARRRPASSVLAGAAFGIAFLVRPTSLLLMIPIALALPRSARIWARFLAAAVPFGVVFLLFNLSAYGKPFQTGYEVGGELPAPVTPGAAVARGSQYVFWLFKTSSPLVIAGWAAIFVSRRTQIRDALLLASWVLSFLLFYSVFVYYSDVSFWELRYLLPAMPAMVAAALLSWKDLARRIPDRLAQFAVLVLPTAVLLVVGTGALYTVRHGLLRTAEDQSRYPKALLWVKETIPPHSLVVSRAMSGAVRYYTDLTPVRWEYFDPERFEKLHRRADARGDRIYALLLKEEVSPALKACPAPWKRVGEVMDVVLFELPGEGGHGPVGKTLGELSIRLNSAEGMQSRPDA